MQIMIDISPDLYTRLFDNGVDLSDADKKSLEIAVRKGTVLPENHGRLIDADSLWDLYHDNDYDFYEAIDSATTIIEGTEGKE